MRVGRPSAAGTDRPGEAASRPIQVTSPPRDPGSEPLRVGFDLGGVEGAGEIATGPAERLGIEPGTDRAAHGNVAHPRRRKPHMDGVSASDTGSRLLPLSLT